MGLDVQVKSAMNAEQGQHMIEKRDAGVDIGLSLSVQVEFDLYLGF
jgi:hypothetical protein